MLSIDIITLFPGMFCGPLSESLLGKARSKGLVNINVHDLRGFTQDKHHQVDDRQFGGGSGMLLKVEPLFNALKSLYPDLENEKETEDKPHIIYLSPQGKLLSNDKAVGLSKKKRLILVCGHYEGIDDRAMRWIDEEISIGDYVLTGGEIPAMAVADAVCRMVPGVVKEWESVENDSFYKSSLLDHSNYTRPSEFMGMKVPETLLSGNHKEIRMWRLKNSIQNTLNKRPELMDDNFKRSLTARVDNIIFKDASEPAIGLKEEANSGN